MNYYNDNDPKKTAWLRQLIADGVIPKGHVDERPIQEIEPKDLEGYAQHHFFAGIGGWSFAFALAGIGEDEEAASCSCPCQPFSQTGKQLGEADPRHLFPQFHRLAKGHRFSRIFGEQVASAAGRVWVERVRVALEDLGYLFEWTDLCAAGVSAPQARQRIYWVAYANCERRDRINPCLREKDSGRRAKKIFEIAGSGEALSMAHRALAAAERGIAQTNLGGLPSSDEAYFVGLGDTDSARSQGRNVNGHGRDQWTPWETSVALLGRDGKSRRIEPGIFPLAHGVPDRVGLIGGAGNAIVPLLAAEFVQACEEARYLELLGV